MYLLTLTHTHTYVTELVTKPHSRKEYFSGDSSKVAAVQSNLK